MKAPVAFTVVGITAHDLPVVVLKMCPGRQPGTETVVLLTVVPVVESVESFFLVRVPTNPVPFVNPAGVSVSSRYLFWNLMTARAVAGPK